MPKDSKVKSENRDLSFSLVNIIALVIVIIIAGFIGWGFDIAKQNKTISHSEEKVAAVQSIVYNGQEGKNALELLKGIATIQTQDSSMGTFVTAINDIQNTNTQYWMFYVNNELAPVAADQYQTKNDDKIQWRFEDIGNFQ